MEDRAGETPGKLRRSAGLSEGLSLRGGCLPEAGSVTL